MPSEAINQEMLQIIAPAAFGGAAHLHFRRPKNFLEGLTTWSISLGVAYIFTGLVTDKFPASWGIQQMHIAPILALLANSWTLKLLEIGERFKLERLEKIRALTDS